MVYLLDQMGLGSGYSFEYRHYGPYSAELSEEMEDDVIFRRLNVETKRRQSDGVPYTVYKVESDAEVRIDSPLPWTELLTQCGLCKNAHLLFWNYLLQFIGFQRWSVMKIGKLNLCEKGR
jgi:hypothetical protein